MTQQITLAEPTGKPLIELRENSPTFMQLLSIAITNNAAIDVIERLAALQEKAVAQRALVEFNEALNRVQNEIKRVAPDLDNPQTHSKYASYAAIDRAIRPIYSREGFSLSFTHEDCSKAEHVRVICRVARGAHVQNYQIDMPADGKGAKGGDVMTKTHATAAADSYAKRYLVKDIFNIAIGQDDQDGNSMDIDELNERLAHFAQCKTIAEVFDHFKMSYMAADEAHDVKAQIALSEAKDNRKKEIQSARVKS